MARISLSPLAQVAFLGEEGSDFGGVRREWYHLITLEMINPQYGIFEPSAGDPYRYLSPPGSSAVLGLYRSICTALARWYWRVVYWRGLY